MAKLSRESAPQAVKGQETPRREELRTLNETVVDFLLETRGKLMKKATMSEVKREKKLKKVS